MWVELFGGFWWYVSIMKPFTVPEKSSKNPQGVFVKDISRNRSSFSSKITRAIPGVCALEPGSKKWGKFLPKIQKINEIQTTKKSNIPLSFGFS